MIQTTLFAEGKNIINFINFIIRLYEIMLTLFPVIKNVNYYTFNDLNFFDPFIIA